MKTRRGFWPSLTPLLVLIGVLAAGCARDTTQAPDLAELVPEEVITYDLLPRGGPSQCFLDRSNALDTYTEAQLDEIALCPMAIFPLRNILAIDGYNNVMALKQRNPDMLIFGVHQVLALPMVWNEVQQRDRFPMTAKLYDLLINYIAYTTEGEIAWRWPGNAGVNPWGPNKWRADVLIASINIMKDYDEIFPGAVDGIFQDYLSPVPSLYDPGTVFLGEIDLDGDGVPVNIDPDGIEAWQGWQKDLIEETQVIFGDDFVQTANGRLPVNNPDVRKPLAGLVFEWFPNMPWSVPDLEGWEILLDTMEPDALTPRRGRTWTMLWDATGTNVKEWQVRISSLLSGEPYMLTDRFEWIGFDEMMPIPGEPLEPMQRVIFPNGVNVFTRKYEKGEAKMQTNVVGDIIQATWFPGPAPDDSDVHPGAFTAAP